MAEDFLSMSMALSRLDVRPVGVVEWSQSLSELNQLIRLLEVDLPSGIQNPKNEKLEARIRAIMKRYFRNLGVALPVEQIEQIYYRYVEQE